MEQQLINALIKLIAKAGGGTLVRDLVQQVDEDGNPKTWTASEVVKAIQFINWQSENFGTAEATAIIAMLSKKYNVNLDDLHASDSPLESTPDVRGLQ